MIYLDSNVFIFAVLSEDKKGEKAQEILTKVIQGKIEAYTSAITINEFTWVLLKEGKDKDRTIKESLRLLEFANLHIIPLNEKIVQDSLELMKNLKNLKPRDAVHLASCFHKNIPTIVSDDSDFENIKGIKRISLD